MINVIVPLMQEPEDKNFVKVIKKAVRGAQVIVGIIEGMKEVKEADLVCVFQRGASCESMLGTLVQEVGSGPIIILKDLKRAGKLGELVVEGKDIVMFKRKKKAYWDMVADWMSAVAYLIFGFKLYGGCVGVIYFNEKFATVLKNMPLSGVSLSTRVNRFIGAEVHYIELEKAEITKYVGRFNIWRSFVPIIINSLILTVGIISLILFSGFFGGYLPLGIMLASVIFITFALEIFFLFKFLVILNVGELIVPQMDKILRRVPAKGQKKS